MLTEEEAKTSEAEQRARRWAGPICVGVLIAISGPLFFYDSGIEEGVQRVNSEYRVEFERTMQPSIKIGADCGQQRELTECFLICERVTEPWWEGTECKRSAARAALAKAGEAPDVQPLAREDR